MGVESEGVGGEGVGVGSEGVGVGGRGRGCRGGGRGCKGRGRGVGRAVWCKLGCAHTVCSAVLGQHISVSAPLDLKLI